MLSNKIEEIDKNFIVKSNESDELTYFDVVSDKVKEHNLFEVSGFPWMESNESIIGLIENTTNDDSNKPTDISNKNKSFCRLEISSLHKFSQGVQYLAWCTSGGVIRFASDTGTIAVKVELTSKDDMSHMPRTGSAGVDLYVGKGKNKKFIKSAMPGNNQSEYKAIFEGINPKREMCEWTLNMPLYNGVKKFEIGLPCGSKVERPTPYSIEKPIVFYGSSITQGGCASRPGNSYTHIICRWLDANMVNLGFSGNAKGEPEMAELISKIDMSAFIMDYDHNAPNAEHLRNTHENFFKIIRANRPYLPVIFVSMPDFDRDIAMSALRRDIIYRTYNNAVNDGDKNVYFVDGETLFGTRDRDSCTVDGCHPNDLGFMRMAENIYPVVKKALDL